MKNGYYLLAYELSYFELMQNAETRLLTHSYSLMGWKPVDFSKYKQRFRKFLPWTLLLRINYFFSGLCVAKERIYYHCQLSVTQNYLRGQFILQPKLAELLIHWVAVYTFTAREHISFFPFWPILMKCKNHLVIYVNLLSHKITIQTSTTLSR